MTHPNEDLVRRGYEAFGTGDIATLQALFTEDVVWHFPGSSEVSGDFKGQAEVLGWLAKNAELSGGTIRVTVHDVLANDDHAVGLIRVTAQREGRSLDDPSAQVFHIKDGKVTEAWIHPSDQAASDAFWS